jgi:predicted DNA-binding antitoxin AbrB/MazE fold protein
MTYEIEAIYDHGVLRPIGPLSLAEGARVHLRVEDGSSTEMKGADNNPLLLGRIPSPRLAHPEQTADFKMEVLEAADASL